MRVVVVVVAALLLAGVAEAQTVANAPACRAEHSGEELITRIVFPDGYTVEGPWHITGVSKQAKSTSMTAILDHIIETKPVDLKRQLVELPGPVQMTFKGKTIGEVLDEAASLWCATVLKVRPVSPPLSSAANDGGANRIM